MNSNPLPPNKDWLAVVLVISFLGLFALAGLIGGLYLLATGKAGDAGLTSLFTITATAVGALGSMLANTRQAPPPISPTTALTTTVTPPATTGTSDITPSDSNNDESKGTAATKGTPGSGDGGSDTADGNSPGAGS